jgi:hypothetical protein
MVIENYAGAFRALANKHGLRLSIEAYDGAPCDDMRYASQADEPMAEFWSWEKYACTYSCTEMASAAHVYGKKIVGAEAFTANASERWLAHPAYIKDLGDWAFCEGINRFLFHRYAAQPWTNRAPGMSMGPWGLHYERTQTWWEQSRAWHDYLARCQYLLRQGLFVADIAYLQPEGAPRRFTSPADAEIAPHIRGGYNFDGCNSEAVIERMSVRNGRIVLPDGMSYRVLVLPDSETMTPRLLRKIKALADAGATIIGGTKPPQKSPSLADLGTGDTEVRTVAADLWSHGGIITGKTVRQVLEEHGVKPDFTATINLRYIHRTIGHTEVYFVANPEPNQVEAVASFRISGKQPELWQPDSGRIGAALVFQEEDGVTTVPLQFEASGSIFVVFRKPSRGADPIVSVSHDGLALAADPNTGTNANAANRQNGSTASGSFAFDFVQGEIWQNGSYLFKSAAGHDRQLTVSLPAPQEILGPWEVSFDPKWGGPAKVTFEKLEDWSKRPEEGIKYYSGTATYRKMFIFQPTAGGQRFYLDLGKVAIMAEVKLNGKDLGILWKPPFRCDVTDALKPGENTLELNIVNLWINRLIGDEQLPEDSERRPGGYLKSQSWPQWVLDGKPSPAGRFTFTSCRLWNKKSPLVQSGLIGPVKLYATKKIGTEP